jgi:hypothetical protein
MQIKQKFYFSMLAILFSSFIWLSGCNNDDDGGGTLSNEIAQTSSGTRIVIEKDTTIMVSYEFIVPAREAGTLVVTANVTDLTYGVNYTTNPAEASGVVTIPFESGASTVSFQIVVIDDDANLPNGKVKFVMSEVTGENAAVSTVDFEYELTILDNEGESINADSEEMVLFGEVVPGSESDAKEITFSTLNIVTDITAVASEGFSVSGTIDGTYAATVALSAEATSVFVKASPSAGAAFGVLTGSVTLSAGDAELIADVSAIVADVVGVLFWAEDFNYPVDDTYPSYGESGTNWGIIPVSAYYRHSAAYNGTTNGIVVQTGLSRTGVFDTWYTGNRLSGLGMGDSPLEFVGYPGSGVGRTLRLGMDITNRVQRNDCKDEGLFLAKNTTIIRRFVDDDNEIKSGNVYFSTMIKVNAVFPEETTTLKNAIAMLTGDANFVNNEAMKLNVKDNGAGGFNFGVSKSSDDGSVVYGATSYNLGETYAIVFKVEIKADLEGENPNDVVSVYVFKAGDIIPAFEESTLVPEAQINADNQDIDVHDVVNGLETFFIREVADVFAAGGTANVAVQDVDFSGIRVATSWPSLFKDTSEALSDSESEDLLQSIKYGRAGCSDGPGEKIGNVDK